MQNPETICYYHFPDTYWYLIKPLLISNGASRKDSACQCRRHKKHAFDPWVRKIPWSRKWQPTPVFLPGKSHGQRILVGYSPRGRKESDTTERLYFTSLYSSKYKPMIFISFCSKGTYVWNASCRYKVLVLGWRETLISTICDP